VLVDLVEDGPGADLVDVVLGGQLGDGLAVLAAGDVDRDDVAVLGRALGVGQFRELRAQPVELGVDLLLAGLGPGDGDPQAAVAGHLHHRADLDDGLEGHRPLGLSLGDLQLWRCDHIDVVLAHGVEVEVGYGVLDGLAAAHLGTEARLEDATGCLAGTEAGNPDLAGELLEGTVDSLVELVLVDLDRHLDLVAL
jgi:hypothetical protein